MLGGNEAVMVRKEEKSRESMLASRQKLVSFGKPAGRLTLSKRILASVVVHAVLIYDR